MKTIHKIKLDPRKERLRIKGFVKPLCVMMQNEMLCLWYEANTESATVNVLIHVYGTEFDIDGSEDMQYVGSVIDGPFVWHVYCDA